MDGGPDSFHGAKSVSFYVDSWEDEYELSLDNWTELTYVSDDNAGKTDTLERFRRAAGYDSLITTE